MRCNNCGAEMANGGAFCTNCGARLRGGAVSAPVNRAKRGNTVWIAVVVIVFLVGAACIGTFVLIGRMNADKSQNAHIQTTDTHTDDTYTADAHTDDTHFADMHMDDTGTIGVHAPDSQTADAYITEAPVTDAAGGVTAAETVKTGVSDANLIGLWSTEGPSGTLVDPATGMATGSVYNGEWYLFREDGTYRYVIIGSGSVLNGGVVCEGRYSADNGEILLTDIRESWYPNPASPGQTEAYKNKRTDDTSIRYQYGDDGKTLIVDDIDYFTRVEN